MLNCKAVFIAIFAFVGRITALFLLGRHLKPELWEYDKIALNLIQKKEYAIEHLNTIHRSYIYPVYPMICAIFRFLTGRNYFLLEIFQITLSSLSCFFIYLVARKIYSEKVALAASFLVAIHPGLIVYSTKIHELTLVVFLNVVIFYLVLHLDCSKIYNNLLIGSLIGIGTLTRPTLIFLLPALAVYLRLFYAGKKNILRVVSLVFLSSFLLILPWTIRNFIVHKRWVFITTTSAQQLWIGNNPEATGSGLAQDGISVLNHSPKEFRDKLFKLNEIQQSDLFYEEAVKFIKSYPYLFAKMLLRKFFYFWWFSPEAGKLYPAMWAIIYKAFYIFLFFFFVLGCYFSLKGPYALSKAPVLSLLILFFLVSFLHSIYYVEIRHRWSIEPLMCIFSAFGLSIGVKKLL